MGGPDPVGLVEFVRCPVEQPGGWELVLADHARWKALDTPGITAGALQDPPPVPVAPLGLAPAVPARRVHGDGLRLQGGRRRIRTRLAPSETQDVGFTTDLDELSVESLREKAEASVSGETTTTTTSTSRTTYRRSDVVKEYALRVADGVCQGCGEEAPFLGTDGEPFLEVHHLYRRSDGGADHPDNVIALCPNCHRRVHYGQDGDNFNQQLIDQS